jgi:hypothetical protein
MQVGKQGKKEEGIANMFLFPRKYINILKWATNLNDFQKVILHKTVFKYYNMSKFCTAKNVIFALREKKKKSIWRLSFLHYKTTDTLSFQYRITHDGHKFLTEWGDTVVARLKYLQVIHDLWGSGGS